MIMKEGIWDSIKNLVSKEEHYELLDDHGFEQKEKCKEEEKFKFMYNYRNFNISNLPLKLVEIKGFKNIIYIVKPSKNRGDIVVNVQISEFDKFLQFNAVYKPKSKDETESLGLILKDVKNISKEVNSIFLKKGDTFLKTITKLESLKFWRVDKLNGDKYSNYK